jgi:hypothetical protein
MASRPIGVLNEKALSSGAGTFPAGHSRTVTLTEAETVGLGPGPEFAGAVFSAMALDAGDEAVAEGDAVLFMVDEDGDNIYVLGASNANIEVDNDGTLQALADHLKFGVVAATGDLSVRSDDGTVTVLITRLA